MGQFWLIHIFLNNMQKYIKNLIQTHWSTNKQQNKPTEITNIFQKSESWIREKSLCVFSFLH